MYCNSIADRRNKGAVNADSVACNMERDPWGGPSVLMWSRICLSFKRGLVIFQSIGQGKGNGVMGALYIDQGLRPYVVPFFARHWNNTFHHDKARAHFGRAPIKTTWLLRHDLLLVRAKTWLNIGGVRFKDDLMKSKQGRQRKLNVVHSSSGFRLVLLWHLSIIQCTGDVLLLSTPMQEIRDTDFRSSFLLKSALYCWQKCPKNTICYI